MKSIINKFAVLVMMALIGGCGGGTDAFTSGTTTTTTTTTSSATSISLSTSLLTINSDNSNSATITATVLDANNAAVSGETVTFASSAGQLSASSGVTDGSGQVAVNLSSGTSDPSNRTITVTATVTGITSAQIPITVSGSTLSMGTISSLIIGGAAGTDQTTITVTAKDSASNPVYNVPITFSVAASGASPGAATLSATSVTTDVSGKATATLTATSVGTVTVTATGLGATANQVVTITSPTTAFSITAPTSNPATLPIGGTLTVTVSAPSPTTSVTFATTLGTWAASGTGVATVPVSGGVASAVLSSSSGGTASVQVTDASNSSTSATLAVLISAPSATAAQIALQPNVSVLAPSSGDTKSQATLTATVRTSGGDLVSGAPVYFSLSNNTGGGETIEPVFGTTDNTGQLQATFTSGSLSSDAAGVTVTATVLDGSSSAIAQDSTSIVINQKAGSVVLGTGTTVGEPVVGGALYALPMSVVVADSNGNAVKSAVVSLKAWPSFYSTGVWVGTSSCTASISGTWPNEDTNGDLILGPTEDVPYIAVPSGGSSTDQGITITDTSTTDSYGRKKYTTSSDLGNGIMTFVRDGVLTPANSTAGTLPTSVTTDANGVANFTLYYAKEYAAWITDEITASTTVLGTETTGSLSFTLPASKTDADSCLLGPYSPFDPKSPTSP